MSFSGARGPSYNLDSMVRPKVYKKGGEEPTELETRVGQAIADLETSNKDLKADLAELYIVSVREVVVDAAKGKKALVVFVPFVLHKQFKKIQARLVRELEKKFSGYHVLILAQRTIFGPSYSRKNRGALRPMSRTLTAVHKAMLEDLVYPTEIVGKRTRVRMDGSKLLKVHLDSKDQSNVEHKLQTYAEVYKRLTNKVTEFMFQ